MGGGYTELIETNVQCEIISMPSHSKPLCSLVKSVARPDDDDKTKIIFLLSILFPGEDLEEETNVIEDNHTKYGKFTYF